MVFATSSRSIFGEGSERVHARVPIGYRYFLPKVATVGGHLADEVLRGGGGLKRVEFDVGLSGLPGSDTSPQMQYWRFFSISYPFDKPKAFIRSTDLLSFDPHEINEWLTFLLPSTFVLIGCAA